MKGLDKAGQATSLCPAAGGDAPVSSPILFLLAERKWRQGCSSSPLLPPALLSHCSQLLICSASSQLLRKVLGEGEGGYWWSSPFCCPPPSLLRMEPTLLSVQPPSPVPVLFQEHSMGCRTQKWGKEIKEAGKWVQLPSLSLL